MQTLLFLTRAYAYLLDDEFREESIFLEGIKHHWNCRIPFSHQAERHCHPCGGLA